MSLDTAKVLGRQIGLTSLLSPGLVHETDV